MVVFRSPISGRRSFAAALLIICGIIIVAVGSAGAVYWLRQPEVDRLNQHVAQLSGQITQLKNEAATPPNPQPQQTVTVGRYVSTKGVEVRVYAPEKDSTIASPVAVVGEVPGSWSFEASFPIRLVDSSGKVVAQSTAQVLGDWMTDQLVPFSAKLPYVAASAHSGSGSLILQKDNPSGRAANDDTVVIPVRL